MASAVGAGIGMGAFSVNAAMVNAGFPSRGPAHWRAITETVGTEPVDDPASDAADSHAPLWKQESDPPVRGGILPTALGKDIENLLVMHYVNGPLRIAAGFCYRRLVQYRALGYHDLEVAPDMADSWEILDDGRTYVFHIHPGIHWHDIPPVNGREFTADDVGWTIDYYRNQNDEYGYLWAWVSSWEAPDKYTIVIHTDQPNAEALQMMAVDNNVMLAREVFEQDGSFKERVIGTGPFIWDSWDPGVKVQVRRNPNYWEISELDGERLPYLDGVDMFVMPDYAARLAAFRAQRVSGNVWGFQPEPADVDSLVESLPNLRRWDGVRFLSGSGIILNVTRPPWDNVNVRRAASMALDRDAMIADIMNGSARWGGFITAAFEDYAWSEEKLRSLPYLQYNPDEARRLIEEAVVGDTPIPIVTYTTSGTAKVLVQTIQQMWQAVGLNATLETTDVPTGYQKRVTGDFSVLGEGVGFSSGSLDAATRQLFHSEGDRNYGRVSDPEIDELTNQLFVELDLEKRIEIVDKFQQNMAENMWFIPHYDEIETILDHAWVMNKAFHWQLAWPYPERIWYDSSRKSAG